MGNSSDSERSHYSRRTFLATAMAAPILAAKSGLSYEPLEAVAADILKVSSPDGKVSSPDGRITFQLGTSQRRLNYQASMRRCWSGTTWTTPRRFGLKRPRWAREIQ